MKMRLMIVVTVFALIAAVAILAVISPRHQSQQTATLLFEGLRLCRFEPGRAGHDKTYAAFRLTNSTVHRMTFWAETLELWDGRKWQTNLIRGTPTNWPHFASTFDPRESGVFYVPPPTNTRWRIRLTCREHSEGAKGFRDRVSDTWYNWENRATGVDTETFSGAKRVIASEEVGE
jgi:hypothetical protein